MPRRRGIDRLAASDTPASRAVACAGVAFATVGVVGLLLLPRLLILWVVLITFGGATIP
jgi:hypothetical protein